MRFIPCVLVALVTVPTVSAQAPDNPSIVQVGVFRIQPDGSVGGYAVETGEAEGEVFAAGIGSGGCRFGAGRTWHQTPPEWATDLWAIRGRVVSLTPEQATIRIEWRRVRASGAPVEQSPQSRELTLPIDQLVALDSASAVNPECGPPTAAVTFGARFAPRRPAGAVRRPTAGGGVSSGALSGSGSATGVGGGVRVVGGRPGGGGGGRATASIPPYDAELWLVHSVPGEPETVVPTVVRVTGGQATFTFASVSFGVPGGTMNVRVDGTVRLVQGTPQQRLLLFEASRAATFTPSDRPSRDPVAPDRERLDASAPLPGPTDVLAYEMPPLKVLDGPAVSDTFSIRLRLKPAGE